MRRALQSMILPASALLLAHCSAAEDLLPLPFHTDISCARAYPSWESMNVYLVWESHVFVISVDLPPVGADTLTLNAAGDCCTVTQHFGEGIAMYVLPAGPAVPFPPDYHHWSREVIGGTVNVTGIPARGEPEFGEVVSVTLEGIDFGDGETHSYGPVDAVTSVYPP